MSKLSPGAAAAIDGINKAGSAVDAALKSARRAGAGYREMKVLLQAMNQAGLALQVLAEAPTVEDRTGVHHGLISTTNDRFLRDSALARQACATEIDQIRLWQAEQVRLLSGTVMHLLRSVMEIALQSSGKLNLMGLAASYLVGALVLFMLDFTGRQSLAMALAFPMAGWAIALFADQQLARAADQIAAKAAQQMADAEQRRDALLVQMGKDRDAMLGQIGQDLKQRLGKIAQITAQADSMLAQRAMEADQVMNGWTQRIRNGFLDVEKAQGAAAPPALLELGVLKCRVR